MSQIPHGKNAGDQLAGICGNGSTCHSHLKHADEKKIQANVGDGSIGQVNKRSLGVAGRI